MKIKDVEKDVQDILKYSMAARCDDHKLYHYYVCKKLGSDAKGEFLIKTFTDIRFRFAYGIASYDSVSRARRKLQERYASLQATPEVIAERKEMIKKYKLYAKGGDV
jgi:hypothetical protein